LPGQEVVIYQVCAGGLRTEIVLHEVLKEKHGIETTVFTAGPATPVYVAIQTPPLLNLCRKMEQHCPDAFLINQSNPLPALHRLVERTSTVEVYSYCFGSRNSERAVANTLGIDPARVKIEMTGADHVGAATQILVDGEDRYAEFMDLLRREGYVDQGEWGRCAAPADVSVQWGIFFNTCHPVDIFREPYRHDVLDSRVTGHHKGHITYRENFREILEDYVAGRESEFEPPDEIDDCFVWLECLAEKYPGRNVHWVNLTNRGLVENVLYDGVIEVQCVMDALGIRAVRPAKPLPEFVAALTNRHLAALELSDTAAIEHDRKKLIEAIALAPHLDDPRDAATVYENCREALGELIPF